MSSLKEFASASIPGATKVRVITFTEDEIALRSREAFIFAYPGTPRLLKRLIRAGRMDWMLRGERQIIRDIEKPVDFLTHESRAAWVLAQHRGILSSLNAEERRAVAQVVVTAVRVGTRD